MTAIVAPELVATGPLKLGGECQPDYYKLFCLCDSEEKRRRDDDCAKKKNLHTLHTRTHRLAFCFASRSWGYRHHQKKPAGSWFTRCISRVGATHICAHIRNDVKKIVKFPRFRRCIYFSPPPPPFINSPRPWPGSEIFALNLSHRGLERIFIPSRTFTAGLCVGTDANHRLLTAPMGSLARDARPNTRETGPYGAPQ